MTDPMSTLVRPVLVEFAAPATFPIETFSPFCLKVHRALRLVGVPYTSRSVGRPSEVRALNPACQLPVLQVADDNLADSTAILRWVDAQRPGVLVPTEPNDAARAWLWEEHGDAALNGFVVAARWADADNWPSARDAMFAAMPSPIRPLITGRIRKTVLASLHGADVGRHGWGATWDRFRRQLDALDAVAPAEGYWCQTPTPSVADIGLFAQLQSLRTPLTDKQRVWVEERPRLTAWLDRVDEATRARPSGGAL